LPQLPHVSVFTRWPPLTEKLSGAELREALRGKVSRRRQCRRRRTRPLQRWVGRHLCFCEELTEKTLGFPEASICEDNGLCLARRIFNEPLVEEALCYFEVMRLPGPITFMERQVEEGQRGLVNLGRVGFHGRHHTTRLSAAQRKSSAAPKRAQRVEGSAPPKASTVGCNAGLGGDVSESRDKDWLPRP
jgi:hypothetical protein